MSFSAKYECDTLFAELHKSHSAFA